MHKSSVFSITLTITFSSNDNKKEIKNYLACSLAPFFQIFPCDQPCDMTAARNFWT